MDNDEQEEFNDSSYNWEYGKTFGKKAGQFGQAYQTAGKVTTYSLNDTKEKINIQPKAIPAYQFRTAESFLNSLNQKQANKEVDVTQFQEGQRVYHKKFGEGTIQKLEEEGDDYKVDIQFDKSGHKRLMAKFAGLEIIE